MVVIGWIFGTLKSLELGILSGWVDFGMIMRSIKIQVWLICDKKYLIFLYSPLSKLS
jgi:hypothetical protein